MMGVILDKLAGFTGLFPEFPIDPAKILPELKNVIHSDEMRSVPVVVLADNQDWPAATKLSEVVDALHLQKMTDRKWYIQGTCATTGEGLFEGLEELSRLVKDFKQSRRR